MRRLALAFAALGLGACAADLDQGRPAPVVDEAFFRCRVQPVLAQSCAMLACHGDERRAFRVYARNRLRLDPAESKRNALFADEERAANLASARALIDLDDPAGSYLLLKGLESSAGGYFHRGATIFGEGNVFDGRDAADYKTLVDWVGGKSADPTCVEPGSDQ